MPEGAFDIFDKFSQSARNVALGAEQVARGMDSQVSSEHFLLSLCVSKGTLSYDILKDNLISADQIRLVMHVKPTSKGNIEGIADEGKRILKKSVLIAAKYKHLSVDSEHILMSCISDKTINSYNIIVRLGADPEKIKKQLNNLFTDLSEMDRLIRDKVSDSSPPRMLNDLLENMRGYSKKSKSKTPAIDLFTTDLTAQARRNELDKVVGRENEISRVMQILLRRAKNNPVLVGDPGVGKTAIAEGIAQSINDGNIPATLSEKRVLSLDIPQIVAGTVYRGQFEERIKKLISEITKAGNIILFIDEIHNIVGAGSAEGSVDAANIIKPALARGLIRVIGATTHDEYRRFIEKDSALERRLQKVIINEPSITESIEMIRGLKIKYEDYHNVTILDSAIIAACELSERYIADRKLPDKAIDLIDEAAASLTINNKQVASPSAENQLADLKILKEKALSKEDFEKASNINKQINTLISSTNKKPKPTRAQSISDTNVANIVEQWTGIPTRVLLGTNLGDLGNIEKNLKSRIFGQDSAIAEISNAIKRSRIGFSDDTKPIGSFIFLGPTGVGKTSLAREIAQEIFGTSKALIKIDMSEFMERHNVSRLVGAPPGYVGFEEAGKLTEAIRKRPYSVVLFDEIEKAHPDVFNMLLQIMEDGCLTDSQGRQVNFKHSMIVMTSNIGTKSLEKLNIGFSENKSSVEFAKIKNSLTKSLQQQLSPEFINRLDGIIVFRPLDYINIERIATKEARLLRDRLLINNGIKATFSKELIAYIAKTGTDDKFGARPIKRAFQSLVGNTIADYLIRNGNAKSINIGLKNNSVMVCAKSKTKA